MASTDGSVVLTWADGDYTFALRGKQIEHLEVVCKLPFGQLAARLFSQMPAYRDVRETILQGLIGGGMPATQAAELVKTYVDGVPFDRRNDPSSPLKTAVAIMSAAWFGVPELETATSGEAPAGGSPANSTSQPTEQPSSTSE